jgi:hypothetical protein
MMVLLAAPIVRDCCLPVVHTPQCHESKRTDDVTCSSNQQAITEPRADIALNAAVDCELRAADDMNYTVPTHTRWAADRVITARLPVSDLYLRTGALLI